MQSKEELEQWYQKEDPWEYYTNVDDAYRKKVIMTCIGDSYERALDIGAGEGYVTKDLPAKEIHGIEISDLAAERFPVNVKRVHEPDGKYDLVMTTGTLYVQYDHKQIADWIKQSGSRHILISGIVDWLQPYNFGRPVRNFEYLYREYVQRTTLYEVSA
jgi:hypothetical protein